MSESDEKFVTTLLFPNEYPRHLNQVSGLTTRNIVYLKRKFLSKQGYELVSYPLTECASVTYKDERPLTSIVAGVLLLALVTFIAVMVYRYWDDLPPATRIPVGVLVFASVFGFKALFASRRHRLVFAMRDGSKLVWKTRSGDYKYKEPGAAKVVELARSLGILAA